MSRDQNLGEKRRERNRGEAHQLRDGDIAAARAAGDHLRDVAINDHQLRSDADAGQGAANNQSPRIGRESPGQRKGRVNEQHHDKRGPPAKIVASHSEDHRADEHAQKAGGDQVAELLESEEMGVLESGAQISHHEDIKDIEPAPQ